MWAVSFIGRSSSWCPASIAASTHALETIAACATELERLREYGSRTLPDEILASSTRELADTLADSTTGCTSVAIFASKSRRIRLEARIALRWASSMPKDGSIGSLNGLAGATIEHALSGAGDVARFHATSLAAACEPYFATADAAMREGSRDDEAYPAFLQPLSNALCRMKSEQATHDECFELKDSWRDLAFDEDPFFPIRSTRVKIEQDPVEEPVEQDLLLSGNCSSSSKNLFLAIECADLDADDAKTEALAAKFASFELPNHLKTATPQQKVSVWTLSRALDEPNRVALRISRTAIESHFSELSAELRRRAVAKHEATEHRIWRKLDRALHSAIEPVDDLRVSAVAHVLRTIAFYVGTELRVALETLVTKLSKAKSLSDADKFQQKYQRIVERATFATPILQTVGAQVSLVIDHATGFLFVGATRKRRDHHYAHFYAAVTTLLACLDDIRGLPPALRSFSSLLDWERLFFVP